MAVELGQYGILVNAVRTIRECQASAKRQRDALSSRLRAEYEDRAQQERDHNSLITILTATRPL
jgi:hypothetical protein